MSDNDRLNAPVCLAALLVAAGLVLVTPGCTRGTTESTSSGGTVATQRDLASPAAREQTPVEAECKLKAKELRYARWTGDRRTLFTGGPTDVEQPDDEKTIEDGSIEAWDLVKGERTFTFHLGAPMTAAPYLDVSPDGKMALAVDPTHFARANPIALWNLESGGTTFAKSRIRYPEQIDISHDGKLAVADGGGDNVLVLELPSLRVVKEILNDTAASGSMVFSKDDASIVSDWQRSMTLDNPRSLKAKKQWNPGFGSVSPDHGTLAIVSRNFWGVVDTGSGKTIIKFEAPPKYVEDPMIYVRFSPDGKRVAVAHYDDDDTVTVWSAETGKKIGSVKPKDPDIPAWTTDGTVLLTGSDNYDAATMKPLPALPGSVLAKLNGHLVLVGEPAHATEVDATSGKPTGRTFEFRNLTESSSIELSSDNAFIAYPRGDTGSIRVVRVSDQKTLDLAVGWNEKTQVGYAWSSVGSFEGPEVAAGCAAKGSGRVNKARPGLVRDFFGNASIE